MFFIIFGEFVAVLDYLRTQIRHNSTRQMFQKMPGNGHLCRISLVKQEYILSTFMIQAQFWVLDIRLGTKQEELPACMSFHSSSMLVPFFT